MSLHQISGTPASFPPFARKVNNYLDLTTDEIDWIEKLHDKSRLYEPGQVIVQEGSPFETTHIMTDGWAMINRILKDGRRQIINFILPGDVIGLHAAVVPKAEWTVSAITPIRTVHFPSHDILMTMQKVPRVAAIMTLVAARYQSLLSEHITSLGRRNAFERLCQLFHELLLRLRLVDLATERSFPMPLTQELIADAMGLSPVHVNRTLKQIREKKLISIANREIVIHDIDMLEAIADSALDQSNELKFLRSDAEVFPAA